MIIFYLIKKHVYINVWLLKVNTLALVFVVESPRVITCYYLDTRNTSIAGRKDGDLGRLCNYIN